MVRGALKAAAVATLGFTLAGCAVGAIKGNDTGGIILWSPAAERDALLIASQQCGVYGKEARIDSIRRAYGDYITYDCIFGPPRERRWNGRPRY